MNDIEISCEDLRVNYVIPALKMKGLPKGFARKLSARFVDYYCDVKAMNRNVNRRMIPIEDMRVRYSEIIKLIKEVLGK